MQIIEDVYVSLEASSEELEKIKKLHQQNDEKIIRNLQKSVRHCLVDFVSTLDYLANQIYAENCEENPRIKKYFPRYNATNNDFKSHMGRHLPCLKEKNPEMFSKLEKMQFYNDSDDHNETQWMKDLDISKESKHISFSKQQRKITTKSIDIGTKKSPSVFRFGPKSNNVIMRNNTLNGEPMDDMYISNGKVFRESHNSNSKTTVTYNQEIEFYFDELKKPIVPTLQNMLDKITNLIKEFEG